MKDDPKIYDLISSMLDEQKEARLKFKTFDEQFALMHHRFDEVGSRLDGLDEQARMTNARLGAIEFVITEEHSEFRTRIIQVETVLVQHGLAALR